MATQLERLELALDLLRRCIESPVIVEPNSEALIKVTDPDLFIQRFEAVEQQVGFKMDCVAHAGGYCRLTISTERV
jgi:hypothetical protein